MTSIRIKRLTLENFKSHKNLTLDFMGGNASVYGDNATGKTSIYDALTWLLFGKDSQGNGEKNIDLALKVEDDRAKSNALGALFVQLENIKSVFRTLRELSKDPSRPRVLTEKQYLHFIEIINRISYQQYAWAGKYAQRPESLDGDSSLNN
mgnify:CR=1 FL=1